MYTYVQAPGQNQPVPIMNLAGGVPKVITREAARDNLLKPIASGTAQNAYGPSVNVSNLALTRNGRLTGWGKLAAAAVVFFVIRGV